MAMLLDTNMYVITCNMLMLFYQINHLVDYNIRQSCTYNSFMSIQYMSVCLSVCLFERPKDGMHVFVWLQYVAKTLSFSHSYGYLTDCYTCSPNTQ